MICIATDWQKDTYLTKSSAYQKYILHSVYSVMLFFRVEYSTDQKVVQNKTNNKEQVG